MQTLERIIITKNLDFHLEGDKPKKYLAAQSGKSSR